ncbi:MAG: hypothetical protein HYV07_24250 [Deltaproteobacteria bacterium]|nr:hypothetical protein [Deltaproteobacteria bacterium]
MRIEADARIAFPRELVFSTYRDRLPNLVPHLPNVKEIEVLEREDAAKGPGTTRLLNVWHAQGEIPKVAQTVIKPEMLNWKDYALWNQNDWTCEWRVETKIFTENVSCKGKNQFIEKDGATILQIRGELDIDLRGIRGVPKFLAGTVAPVVEKFIVGLLTPNLLSVSDGLAKFLEAEAKAQRG